MHMCILNLVESFLFLFETDKLWNKRRVRKKERREGGREGGGLMVGRGKETLCVFG